MMQAEESPDLQPGEELRPIPGFEDTYAVTSQGRVWSFPRVVKRMNGTQYTVSGGWLTAYPAGRPGKEYLAVKLRRKDIGERHYVHSLVASAFHGPKPEGGQTDHINRNRLDNRVCNLQYLTHREHAAKDWSGERNGSAVLNTGQVKAIRQLYEDGQANQYELAAQFQVGRSTIGRVLRRETWTHL